MWAWVIPFFTKHLWTIISTIADILLILYVGYCVWLQFHPKPTTTQNQRAQTINNYTVNYPDKLDAALGKIGGFEFISYHSFPKSLNSIVQKVK